MRERVICGLRGNEHTIEGERKKKRCCECTPWMETAYLTKGLAFLFMIPDLKISWRLNAMKEHKEELSSSSYNALFSLLSLPGALKQGLVFLWWLKILLISQIS